MFWQSKNALMRNIFETENRSSQVKGGRLQEGLYGRGGRYPHAFRVPDDCAVYARVLHAEHLEEVANGVRDRLQGEHAGLVARLSGVNSMMSRITSSTDRSFQMIVFSIFVFHL